MTKEDVNKKEDVHINVEGAEDDDEELSKIEVITTWITYVCLIFSVVLTVCNLLYAMFVHPLIEENVRIDIIAPSEELK